MKKQLLQKLEEVVLIEVEEEWEVQAQVQDKVILLL